MRRVFDLNIKRSEKCALCGKIGFVSSILNVCKDRIVEKFDKAESFILKAHTTVRKKFNLPVTPPKKEGGVKCNICSNECKMGEGEIGFCGLRLNRNGRLISLSTPEKAPVYTYLDPHVTNCCAAWFCPAGTGLGYPDYAIKNGPEYGYYNLAVFFYGCNFSCLFCQNWEHKYINTAPIKGSDSLANEALKNSRVTCICYFGGDPDVHLPFTITVNKKLIEWKGNRILRICYEWNGDGNQHLVRKAAEQVHTTGGTIKFDLKAPNEQLYRALTSIDPKNVWKNFEDIYNRYWEDKSKPPILTATTLLVPGYIEEQEVEEIAKKIAELDPNIPYSLLVFHPDFAMSDLPVTPRETALKAHRIAKKYLKKVNLGNIFLLGSIW